MHSPETLADLTDYHLYGVCDTCSRIERLQMLVLCDRLGLVQPIATLSRDLKCSQFGAHHVRRPEFVTAVHRHDCRYNARP